MYISKYINIKSLSVNEYIILFFPIILISGSFFINLFLVTISIFFLKDLILKKIKINFFNEIWLLLILLFILYNLVNSFFSNDQYNALRASLGQFRFLFLSLFMMIFIKNTKNLEIMLKFWMMIVLFISIDLIFQNYFSYNLIGIPISISSRPSSFFGEEVVAGAYLTYISLPLFFYFSTNYKKYPTKIKLFYILFYIITLVALTLTGERISLLTFIIVSLIIFYLIFNLKKNIFIISTLSVFFIINYNLNIIFQKRIDDMSNILANIYHSSWGRLWESSYMLFKENILFGVGLKNYRVVCDFQVDPRPDHPAQFCSTHPHNFLLELLAETGLVGTIIFYSFFITIFFKIINLYKKSFKHSKYSMFVLGNFLILLNFVWPIKTSGSFYTTFNGSFFWFSFGIILFFLKNKNFLKN